MMEISQGFFSFSLGRDRNTVALGVFIGIRADGSVYFELGAVREGVVTDGADGARDNYA